MDEELKGEEMKKEVYIKKCLKIYEECAVGLAIMIIIAKFKILPIWITFPFMFYEIAATAFNIGRVKDDNKRRELKKLDVPSLGE